VSAINLVYHCTHSKKVVADGLDGPARTPGTEARVTSRLADRITCGPRRLFVSPQLCTRASKNTHTNCATSVRFLDTFLRLAYFESLKSLQRLSRRRGKVTHRRTKRQPLCTCCSWQPPPSLDLPALAEPELLRRCVITFTCCWVPSSWRESSFTRCSKRSCSAYIRTC
jgi:hypothetical protein